MNLLARWRERGRVDRELAAEMAAHLEERVDELREGGHSEEEARALARRQFGNVTLQQENSRDEWGWTEAAQLVQDVRYGIRVLRKAPAFTVAAIVVLALGIGMNTAMFSAVKAVLLSSLPYPEPDRLFELWQTSKTNQQMNVSGPDLADWRAQNRSFENLAAYENGEATLAGSFAARRVRTAPVGCGFFEVVGTHAAIGRTFSSDDQKPGGAPTILLGYELTRGIFVEPASAIGKTVRLNGMVFSVIGVMPPRFDFPDRAQVWLPNEFFPDDSGRSAHNLAVVGRLRQGVTAHQAQANMNVLAARLARQYTDDRDESIRLVPLYEELVSSVRPALLLLLGAVTLVLLIACVNIASLQMARASARMKELGLRSALGAGRGRLIRQLLTESVLLSASGGVGGLALAAIGVMALRNAAPADIPRMATVGIDSEVLCFTAALSIFAGLLFGLLPASKVPRRTRTMQ